MHHGEKLAGAILEHQWHSLAVEEVTQILASDLENGLTTDEVARRQKKFGVNQLTPRNSKSLYQLFLQQFNQPLLYILLLAGIITLFLQDWIDAVVIFAVVLINAIIGYIQESKAENALAALAASISTEVTVIREGKEQTLPSEELVPGDLVELNTGDKVGADLRLILVNNLQTDESSLTGESVPVDKVTPTIDEATLVADRLNLAYAGTVVISGQGIGLVVAIAEATETGRISQLVEQSTSLKTPLTRKLEKFSWRLLYIILGLAALTFTIGMGQGRTGLPMFQAAVALAVSGIPEELPSLVTITLAIGVSRMAARHAIIRNLPTVETLGSATVICTDKTGTLTENQMTVKEIYAGGKLYQVEGTGYNPQGRILEHNQPLSLATNPILDACLRNGLLCNDSYLEAEGAQLTVAGDPTEAALIIAANKAGLDYQDLMEVMPRLDAIPFDSQFQYMATLHQGSNQGENNHPQNIIYLKGAVETILVRCTHQAWAKPNHQLDGSVIEPLDREGIQQIAEKMGKAGMRFIAFAQKLVPPEQKTIEREDVARGLVFVGLQGMIDPPRPEAVEAVANCLASGIQVKMITGDHATTACAIAQLMKLSPRGKIKAFTGKELELMSDRDLAQVVKDGVVFARVAPEQKLRLVDALQFQGEIVAMTGDGVNDAPALKQADIGIAMGKAGTEVAKESADMILTDDNFASIEAAIEEGRTVYHNLQKAIAFVLPVNGGEALTILASVLLEISLPILPLQILWLNMVSSSALSIPLAFDHQTTDVMQQSPRNPQNPLLSSSILRRILLISLFNWAITFGIFEWIVNSTADEVLARTMAVQALVAAEIFYLLSISQFLPSIWIWLRHRKQSGSQAIAYPTVIGIVCVVILQFLFSQWSILNSLLNTTPLNFTQSLICIIVGLPAIVLGSLFRRLDPLSY